jgi:hypothetical protein
MCSCEQLTDPFTLILIKAGHARCETAADERIADPVNGWEICERNPAPCTAKFSLAMLVLPMPTPQ